MKRKTRAISMLLAVAMLLTLLPLLPLSVSAADHDQPGALRVATEKLTGNFSPFYASTAADQNVADLTGLNLLTVDRTGAVIEDAIDGEKVNYNGTNYNYTGCADVDVNYDPDAKTTTYTAKLRNDLKFWDGTPVTAKDILFTYYTYLDSAYAGPSTLDSFDIIGLRNWRTQVSEAVYGKYSTLVDAMLQDGRRSGYVAGSAYTEEMYNDFWSYVDYQWVYTVQCIYDYVHSNYGVDDYAPMIGRATYAEIRANEGLMVAYAMRLWGFCVRKEINGKTYLVDRATGTFRWDLETTFPTMDDFVAVTRVSYNDDPVEFYDYENTGREGNSIEGYARTAFISNYGPHDPEMAGKGVNSIEGIKMLDDYTVSITVNDFSAPAVYDILGITVAPMHYYGDPAKWDPDNGMYGFERGNLDKLATLTQVPRGAGPYVFESYEDGTVTFSANPNYYKGEPVIKTVQFKEIASVDIAAAIRTGEVDLGETYGSRARCMEIAGYNANGELTGNVITTAMVDTMGFGYIGMNADIVNVNGEPGSSASKALRKALATVLAVYRDEACAAYYGESASVIQYPLSGSSWAAPQPADPDYRIAFSTDAQRNDIYTASMSADEKYAAAKAAALTWFEAAGYTVENGKVVAAPEGAKLSYGVIIPGDGSGDHPSYSVLSMAKAAFEEIGITLEINDPADSNVLWNNLDAGCQELWCAAWGSSIDPDMYQVYHGSNIVGRGGTDSNYYHIDDAELNQLTMEAHFSDDQAFRKSNYRECLNIIADWAVVIPAYQRQDCVLFSTDRINIATLTPDITTFWNWTNDIEQLELEPDRPFFDVPSYEYYYNAVNWAVERGVTSGTGHGKFSPWMTCTREQIMTFLYAAKGKPAYSATENPFTDVSPDNYFFNPVMWAVENHITKGISEDQFGVGVGCTREQAMTFLWASMNKPDPEGTECVFQDVKPGDYYYKAVLWAAEKGITKGVSDTCFGVGMTCTRAQIVTFLYKLFRHN